MGDLLQYFCGVDYHYKIHTKTISNNTYVCLLYNMQTVFGVGSEFSSGDGDRRVSGLYLLCL
jgi:hypothetical protein